MPASSKPSSNTEEGKDVGARQRLLRVPSPRPAASASANGCRVSAGMIPQKKRAQSAAESAVTSPTHGACKWQLTDAHQEWTAGVMSVWILYPVIAMIADASFRQQRADTAAIPRVLLPSVVGGITAQAIFSFALWRAYSMHCRRVWLDRIAAVANLLQVVGIALAAGGLVLQFVFACVVAINLIFLITFPLQARGYAWIPMQWLFRFVALTSWVIIYHGCCARAALTIAISFVGDLSGSMLVLRDAVGYAASGRPWASYWSCACKHLFTVLFVVFLDIASANHLFSVGFFTVGRTHGVAAPYDWLDVLRLTLGTAVGLVCSSAAVWLTGEFRALPRDRAA